MNKRMRELMEKASSNACYDEPSQIHLMNDEIEKFAELIVRECVNQALEEKVSEEWIDKEDDIEDQCYLRGNNGGIVDAVIRIKQHFGVDN